MSLVAIEFVLSVTIIDTQGDKNNRRYHLVSADYAAAVIDAGVVIAALVDMTDSVISSYSISEEYEESSFSFPVGANNTERLSMSWDLQGSGEKRAHSSLVAPKTTLFNAASGPGNNKLDLTVAPVIAWNTAIVTKTTISDGDTPSVLLSGKRA